MLEIIEFIQKHWGIIVTLFGGAATFFWLKADSKYAKKSDVSLLHEQANLQEQRMAQLETKVDNLPSVQDVAKLQVLMTEIKGETKATNTQVAAISHQVGLLLEAKVLKE
ncbi:DUF2730 domain-containing protein [Ursidibacter arcticus]